jgi:hypothetical protein
MATPLSHYDIIREVGQDIQDVKDWGFDCKKWLRIDPSDSLLSAVWTLPPDIAIDPGGGSGVAGTLAYIWLDTSACTDATEYQCLVDITTTNGRKLRARLDVLVRDVTAEP